MLFTRADEVEAQWRLITPIAETWAKERVPELTKYPAGTDGPEAAQQLLARNGHHWLHLSESTSGCD